MLLRRAATLRLRGDTQFSQGKLPSLTRRSTGSADSRERPRSPPNSAAQSLRSSGSTGICWRLSVVQGWPTGSWGQGGIGNERSGQQYWVRKDTANARMNVKPTKVKTAAQVLQPQIVTRSTSGTHRGIAGVPPEPRRLGIGLARESGGVRKCVERRMGQAAPPSQVQQHQRVTRSTRGHSRLIIGARRRQAAALSRRAIAPPGHVWRTPRVTRNTVTRQLRQSKAPGAGEALK